MVLGIGGGGMTAFIYIYTRIYIYEMFYRLDRLNKRVLADRACAAVFRQNGPNGGRAGRCQSALTKEKKEGPKVGVSAEPGWGLSLFFLLFSFFFLSFFYFGVRR